MPHENIPPLCGLLADDPGAMNFFRSLPEGLQHSMMNGSVAAFEELRHCAGQYSPEPEQQGQDIPGYYEPAASAGECTGLIPNGSDKTQSEFDGYKQLFPFADPPSPDTGK